MRNDYGIRHQHKKGSFEEGNGGQPLKMAGKNPISGTMQSMGAAKKGGKYTWTGANNTKW